MPVGKSGFAFDKNASLDLNFAAFGVHLNELDPALAAVLQPSLKILLGGEYDQAGILDGLFAAAQTMAYADPTGDSRPTAASAAPVATASRPSSGSAQSGVTGWFLKGLTIEGFRGINNHGQPLDLKFSVDKVNSISAVNGVGKSSVYDAVRYAILSLSRQSDVYSAFSDHGI